MREFSRKRLLGAVFALTFTAAACGGGSARTATNLEEVAAGEVCAAGGTAIHVGPDANENGVLDPEEAAAGTTRTVCNEDSKPALVHVSAIARGADCEYGGQRIRSGLDDDKNGQLSDAEVDSSQLVCNARSLEVVKFGDVIVSKPSDLAQLEGIEVLVGSLQIDGTKMPAVEVAGLQQVAGEVGVWIRWNDEEELDAPEIVKSVSFPDLTYAANLYLDLESLESLSFPKLKQAGWVDFEEARKLSSITLPALEEASGLDLSDNYQWSEHEGLKSFSAPELRRLGELNLRYNESLSSVSLPKVEGTIYYVSVESNDALETLSLPLVTALGNTYIRYNEGLTSVEFAKVEELMWDGYIEENEGLTSISFPELRKISGLYVDDQYELTSLLLPKLTTGYALRVNRAEALTALDLPEATSLNELIIRNNDVLTTLTAPKQATRYYISINNNPALSRCVPLKLEIQSVGARHDPYVDTYDNMDDSSCDVNSVDTCFAVKSDEGAATPFRVCMLGQNATDAAATCNTLFPGATLATFHTQDEFTMLQTVFNQDSGYRVDPLIGYTDAVTEGTRLWADAHTGFAPQPGAMEPFWSSGEPNDSGGEHCGQLMGRYNGNGSGLVNDTNCGDERPFMCRVP